MRIVASVLAASVISAAGCDSSEPEPAAPEANADRVEVAALGDSITAGSPGFDPDPAARARLGFGADERSQYSYWAERAEPRLSFRNCGVFGERTDEIAVRLEECATGADAIVIQGGINDIAQGRPVADAAADLRSIVVASRELGLEPYLVDVLPWNNGHPVADEPIAELNRLIARIGRDEDVPVIDFHDELEDPAEPGLMRAPLTADGDHPSIAGYRRLGELVAGELAARAPAVASDAAG